MLHCIMLIWYYGYSASPPSDCFACLILSSEIGVGHIYIVRRDSFSCMPKDTECAEHLNYTNVYIQSSMSDGTH